MSAEISFDSNSFQLLIILLLIIGIGCYFYYDNYKIKKSISDLEYKINSLIIDDNPEVSMFDINQNKPNQNMKSELSEENILDQENYPESHPESQSGKYPTHLAEKSGIYEKNEELISDQLSSDNLPLDKLPLELDMDAVENEQLEKIAQDDEKNEWEEINNLMNNTKEENDNIKEISDKSEDNIESHDNIDDMLNNLLIQNNEPMMR